MYINILYIHTYVHSNNHIRAVYDPLKRVVELSKNVFKRSARSCELVTATEKLFNVQKLIKTFAK